MKDKIFEISFVISAVSLLASAVALSKVGERTAAQSPPPPESPALPALEQEVASLRAASNQQRTDFEHHRQVMRKLAIKVVSAIETKVVGLDLQTKRYAKVDTDNGFLLVSCQDVQPYLDGQKVKLHIGNPLLANQVGFKINARWGRKMKSEPNSSDDYGRWHSSLKSEKYSYTQTLESGQWNVVELILPQTPATELGHIEVSIDTDTVSLMIPHG